MQTRKRPLRADLTDRRAAWLVYLVAALACGPAAAQHPVVVVDARVISADPVLADGSPLYALAVEHVVLGEVPGSTIAARGSKREPRAARVAERAPAGMLYRMKLRLGDDGIYELLGVYPAPIERAEPGEEVPPPGGLASPRSVADRPGREIRSGVPRRIRSALEDNSFEQQVVELVNQERATYGGVERPPLKRVTLLDTSAEGHSSRMETQNFFSHCDLVNLSTHGSRMTAAGYDWMPGAAAENISAGLGTPNDVMYFMAPFGWMNSDGHRASILDTASREIGVGYVFNNGDAGNVTVNADTEDCDGDLVNQGPYRHYWTQNFGRRNGVYPLVIDREASSTNDQSVELYIYNATVGGETQMTQMRFSNNDADYSTWEPYDDEKIWSLSSGGGEKTVWVQLDSADAGSTADVESSDGIWFNSSCNTTTLQNQELDGSPSTFQDCEIIAGPNVEVTGDTTFLADIVRLRDGFTVEDGADFEVGPQP